MIDARKRKVYAGIILDMLLARPSVAERYASVDALTNKQLVYYDPLSKTVRPIHELARRFYLTEGYLRPGGLLNATVQDIPGNRAATSERKRRAFEPYIICCMEETATPVLAAQPYNAVQKTLGHSETVFDGRALVRHNFGSQRVPNDISWKRALRGLCNSARRRGLGDRDGVVAPPRGLGLLRIRALGGGLVPFAFPWAWTLAKQTL